MKKIFLLIAMISAAALGAQDMEKWKSMSKEQRRESMKNMTTEQRSQLLKQYRQNMLLEELKIPKERQTEFNDLYEQYEDSQRKIKQGFKPKNNYSEMSDAEARAELDNSFRVGEQLLRNRRDYSEKFQRVVKPQQVLEMFQNEGEMRSRMMDRRVDGNMGTGVESRERPRFENGGTQSPSLRNKSAGSRGFRN